jgi:hypothetical protein
VEVQIPLRVPSYLIDTVIFSGLLELRLYLWRTGVLVKQW